jgi:hypothetical protein
MCSAPPAVVAQQPGVAATGATSERANQNEPVATDEAKPPLSPEQKMKARFPQPVRVGDLIRLPVLDGDDRTIGYVEDVVRTGDGKIKLIVPYAPWFGWAKSLGPFSGYRRPVAVPIEVVVILARQINALEMDRPDFDRAPTWSSRDGASIGRDETIKIGLGRR